VLLKNPEAQRMTPEDSPAHPGPLSGLRVIELGQILAGPFAGAIFADLGAEVLKIERVDGGDDGRRMGPVFRGGDALNFHLFNRGKKSLALDLKSEAGLAAFERLVASADILIHNLRPGVTHDMGIDGPSLCQRHPRLIYGEISAFGHTGPMQFRPGYEPLLQAFSGLSSTNGGPDDPPMRLGASVVDQGTGMWVVIGTLAMLQQRHITGRGGVLHSSLLETALTWNAQKSEALIHEGREPMRHASGHSGFVPYEAFDTLDGPLLICCGNDRLFAKLAQVVGQAPWAGDVRFATNRARIAHKNLLLENLRAVLRTQSRDHWQAQFLAVGVPCSPVHTVAEALAQEQVQALGLRVPVPGEGYDLHGLPLLFDGQRLPLGGPVPHLGQHNSEFQLTPTKPAHG
jgi:formyl-CoA transferase